MTSADVVEQRVRGWLQAFVVGLNLCPFAHPLVGPGARRLRVTQCWDAELHRAVLRELDYLQSTTETEVATTLLVFPAALESFGDFLDFFADAQGLLVEAGLEGLIQLASFHPDYQFADEPPGAASHYSNRAPYPIVHLLREDMMERALEGFSHPEAIPATNIETLQSLGLAELQARWQALFKESWRQL